MKYKANRLIALLMTLMMMFDLSPASALAGDGAAEPAEKIVQIADAVQDAGGPEETGPAAAEEDASPEGGTAQVEIPSDSAQFGLPLEMLQRNQYSYRLPAEGHVLIATILEELGIECDVGFEASVKEKSWER